MEIPDDLYSIVPKTAKRVIESNPDPKVFNLPGTKVSFPGEGYNLKAEALGQTISDVTTAEEKERIAEKARAKFKSNPKKGLQIKRG